MAGASAPMAKRNGRSAHTHPTRTPPPFPSSPSACGSQRFHPAARRMVRSSLAPAAASATVPTVARGARMAPHAQHQTPGSQDEAAAPLEFAVGAGTLADAGGTLETVEVSGRPASAAAAPLDDAYRGLGVST